MMRGCRLGIAFLLFVVSLTADDSAAGYVDAAACRSCHAGIYDEYRKTTMGRALPA
jgi:hypothetical protein